MIRKNTGRSFFYVGLGHLYMTVKVTITQENTYFQRTSAIIYQYAYEEIERTEVN